MNTTVVTGFVGLAISPALIHTAFAAQTNCAGQRALSQAQIQAAVSHNMICIPRGSGWQDQEYHTGTSNSDGNIIDYKLAPASPSDPTTVVGNYTTATVGGPGVGNSYGNITYHYNSGGNYTFSVFTSGGNGAAIFLCPAGGGAPMETGVIKGFNNVPNPGQACGGTFSGVVGGQ